MDSGYLRDYRVLYVDDEPANLLVFEAAYGDEFNVVCASSGQEALQVLRSTPVAVLVSDYKMPGMTGLELCEVVRRTYPSVRRVLATAYSDQRTAVAAINRGGVEHYIEKPLDPDEVVTALRECIHQAHVEQTTRQLRAAVVERERAAALAAARASILHDLGNMGVVVSACARGLRSLLERSPVGLQPDVREELDELLEAVDYLTTLQRRTRHIGALTGRSRDAHRVDEILRTAVRMLDQRVATNTRLVVEPTDLSVYADRIDVTRIVTNIVSNAVEAIEESGIVDGEIRVSASTVREHTVIRVRDNGPGISDDARKRVFEINYTSRRERGGSGLGLPICAELAEANGGGIDISPQPQPRGVTFVITLPAEAPDSPDATSPMPVQDLLAARNPL